MSEVPIRAIRDRLRLVYGIPAAKPHGDPIAELVLTVLSQSTNDRNRDAAYFGLRERFDGDTWTQVRDAPVDEIEEAIRPGGISKVKSARIKQILQAITDTSQPDDARAAQSGEAGSRAGARPARLEIVEENLDECVLCELCINAAPAGTVKVIKLYSGETLPA